MSRVVDLPSTTHNKRAREEKEPHYYLALARIRVGVGEERVGEVPGLSATFLSVLATVSGRSVGASNSSTCTSTILLLLGVKSSCLTSALIS